MLAFNLNPTVDRLFSLVLRSTKTFCAIDLHFQVSLRYGADCTFFVEQAALQCLGMGCSEAGIGQRRGCHDRVLRPHPTSGRTFPWQTLLCPARSPHSTSLRLALHPKTRIFHPFQLPNSGSIVCTFPHAFLSSENRTQQKQPELVSSVARFDFCLIKQELCGWKSVELKYIPHKAYFNTLEILHAIGYPAIGH